MHAKSAPLLFPHVSEWGGLAWMQPFFREEPLFSCSSTLKGRQKGAPDRETFRVPSPMSKILDGVAWLAASHGSTLEDVTIK